MAAVMRAQQIDGPGQPPVLREVPRPEPAADEVLIRVRWCGVCRTDLHIRDGDIDPGVWPVTPGHEVIGEVAGVGAEVTSLRRGDSVGVPWLGRTCGHCKWCGSGRENLCDAAQFTGFDRPGGYAEYMVAAERYCFALPEALVTAQSAPLLCAGLIGYRTLRMAGEGIERVGIYGFGAAAHLVAPIARHRGAQVYAFTRPGDAPAQAFARELGCVWAGNSDQLPPEKLDAALIFAPVGALVPQALRAVDKGGTVVCGGIHMSDIPAFAYRDLWEERRIVSVANLTRADGEELLALAAELELAPTVTLYPLEAAARALEDLRAGRFDGAAVLEVGG